jgi:hypothetical protein
MLTSLVLSLSLTTPAQPAAAPAGPAPRLVEVKGENGKVTIPVVRPDAAAPAPVFLNGNGNGNGGGRVVVHQAFHKATPVELSEVKDLKVYSADGKEVTLADATKKLAAGGTVVVSADGKAVAPRHLRLFRDDVLVFVSPELAATSLGAQALGAPGFKFQVLPGQPNGQPLVIPFQPNGQPAQPLIIPVQPGQPLIVPGRPNAAPARRPVA